jgi:hypothetical protein
MTDSANSISEEVDTKENTVTETIPSDTDSNQNVGNACMYEDVELGAATCTDDPDISKTTPSPSVPPSSFLARMMQCAYAYDFLIGLIVVIVLAKAYPPLGAKYLKPQITATWIAVIYIFRK